MNKQEIIEKLDNIKTLRECIDDTFAKFELSNSYVHFIRIVFDNLSRKIIELTFHDNISNEDKCYICNHQSVLIILINNFYQDYEEITKEKEFRAVSVTLRATENIFDLYSFSLGMQPAKTIKEASEQWIALTHILAENIQKHEKEINQICDCLANSKEYLNALNPDPIVL